MQFTSAPQATKMHSNDRILSLTPINEKATDVKGMIDKRLFTGENTLHAMQGPGDTLWSLRYDKGIVPNELKQKFTSFQAMYKFASQYYAKRHVAIKEI